MRRLLAVTAAGCIALGCAAVAATPAAAVTQATAVTQAPQVRYNLLFPGLTHWFAKPQTAPLEPLLRFYMLEHTNTYPRSWRATFCLHKWHFDVLHAKWVQRRVFECAHLSKADLATPGDEVTWHLGDQPYPFWYCKTGWYFVSFGEHNVSSDGIPQHTLNFSPFHKGSRVKSPVYTSWGRVAPTKKESHHQTSCKKVKGG